VKAAEYGVARRVQAKQWDGTFLSAYDIDIWCRTLGVRASSNAGTLIVNDAVVRPGNYVVHEEHPARGGLTYVMAANRFEVHHTVGPSPANTALQLALGVLAGQRELAQICTLEGGMPVWHHAICRDEAIAAVADLIGGTL
jgi:hypothetical protein